jgi:hypothetical protein
MGLPADDNLNHQSHEQQQCAELDRLADVLAERLDMGKVMGLLT